MHKRISKILPFVLSVALTCTLAAPCTIRAAAKPQLSASKLELKVGETKKLSVKNNKKNYIDNNCYTNNSSWKNLSKL